MKKTLIAITALSGVAMAATNTAAIDLTDTALKSYWNFTDNNKDTLTLITWGNEFPTLVTGEGYAKLQATNDHPYTQAAGLKVADGFTISFDIKDVTKAGTILSMTTGGMNQDWRSMSITLAATEDNAGYVASAQFHGQKNNAVTTTLTLSDWTTLTLVGDNSGTGSAPYTFNFYVDGELIGSDHVDGAANFAASNTINNLQIGYYGDSTKGAYTSVDNILIYGRALSAKEVKALVPEPATATLSLLALAGLAARRRRR